MTYCLEGHKVKLFNHLFFMPGSVCAHRRESALVGSAFITQKQKIIDIDHLLREHQKIVFCDSFIELATLAAGACVPPICLNMLT
uniref:Uncharacterized protein n=1 Tax=Geospiza parvula TaxID=87175 RepID=A0A8U8ATB2_GEOPR